MGDIRELIARKKNIALKVKNSLLMEISCNQIKKNISLFGEQQANKRQRLANLPPFLRQKILDKIIHSYCDGEEGDIEYFESILKAMPLLLSSESRVIATSGIMTYCPEQLKGTRIIEVLNLIVTHAPRVTELHLNYDDTTYRLRQYTTDDMIRLICKMKNLKTFDSHYVLSLRSLLTICKALRSLQTIDSVPLRLEPSWKELLGPKEIKSAFGRLKAFNFITLSTSDSDSSLGFSDSDFNELSKTILAQQLKNLKAIGNFVRSLYNHERIPVHCGHSRNLDYTSKVAALQHLNVQPNEQITDINAYRMYPSVTNLKISFKAFNGTEESLIDALTPLLQFSKVRNLILDGPVTEEIFSLFVRNYGPKLHSLEMRANTCLCLKSMSIFRLCTKLERLVCIRLHISAHAMDMSRFDRLKILIIMHINGSAGLSNLLKSPNLECAIISIYGEFNVADLQNVSSLVTNRKILQKIMHFSLHVEARESYEYCIQLNNAGEDLVKDMLAFSPLLTCACFHLF